MLDSAPVLFLAILLASVLGYAVVWAIRAWKSVKPYVEADNRAIIERKKKWIRDEIEVLSKLENQGRMIVNDIGNQEEIFVSGETARAVSRFIRRRKEQELDKLINM